MTLRSDRAHLRERAYRRALNLCIDVMEDLKNEDEDCFACDADLSSGDHETDCDISGAVTTAKRALDWRSE